MNLESAERRLIDIENTIKDITLKKEFIVDSIQEKVARIENIKSKTEVYDKAAILLQQVSEWSRKTLAKKIEEIVSEALSFVFMDSYGFVIEFTPKKNRIDSEMFIVVPQVGKVPVLTGVGGGIKDVVSTVLRLLVLEFSKPRLEGPLILDEVGKNISITYQENFAILLKQFSRRFNRQIILVTHQKSVSDLADKKIEIR